MNLRDFEGEYNIGLDIGTGSVGWAVTDAEGKLLHFKSQPTWGSRLFESASPASEARVKRGQRRRYIRRRWRLDLLQGFFDDEMQKVDPEFFCRLRQSRLLREDRAEGYRDYEYPLFNDTNFNERDYYAKFPTIYHLREWLIKTDEKADIRLIYLALHNIVKHRGNFLRQGQEISARTAGPLEALGAFSAALGDWCDSRGYDFEHVDTDQILKVLKNERMSPSGKKTEIVKCIELFISDDKKTNENCKKAMAGAMVGLKVDYKQVFGDFACEESSIRLSEEDKVEVLREAIPDDCVELFEALFSVYSAYLLQGLLAYAPGETISVNMVAKYDQYHEDLNLLKKLVGKYAPDRYDDFFRGPFYPGTRDYDRSKAQGYTKYNLGVSQLSYDDFKSSVKKLFAGTAAENDRSYLQMMEAFDSERFLRRLKTSDNGSIYYQLHLEELRDIIANQKRYYPFLAENADKIESLVTFRIPYYVGPLTTRNAAVDYRGKKRFSWSERRPGMEGVRVTPWNWNEVIDTGKSAENFIVRMTGTCTYLQGEDVLPKCSLLYEEFCVLNELNGLHVTRDGDDEFRLDADERAGIVSDLFHRKRRVSYRDISNWLKREEGFGDVKVSGGQGETGLESKMGSYIFFCKDVFGVEELDSSLIPDIEQIILWNTLFEDRSILRAKLLQEYGKTSDNPDGLLTESQIKTICRKRFTGWGRLSREFLVGLKVGTEAGQKSMMDVLREGDPNSGSRRGRTLVMMEALRDEDLGFQKRVDDFNREYFEKCESSLAVADLPGSPAIRRSINQSLRIVDEIAGIAGHAPANIFIEVTRDEELKKKGNRTTKRFEALEAATKKLKEEYAEAFDPAVMGELKDKQKALDNDRLMLYFMQHGKCLYSGRPINIEELSSGKYEVDHIIPRAYIKDDSLENKALVYREENQRKTDQLLIDPSIRRRMRGYWGMLHEAGLIGDKKYRNLLRDRIGDQAIKGFINRQLVETSQIVKLVQSLLEVRYEQTRIIPVKAAVSHGLRELIGLPKCREANDYHHAHDAYLANRVGLFIQSWYPDIYDNPIKMAHAVRKYIRGCSEEYKASRRMPGSSGFIADGFMRSRIDAETGEVWDAPAEAEVIRSAFNYRQCFISRMPFEDTGAFWDATIYSPKSGKNLGLPLKQGLDPNKYGSYSREQFAYFFIYEARKGVGKKRLFKFAEVPVWLAIRINGDSSALENYAKELAAREGLEFVRIERSKVLKKQVIEIDGDRLIITGKRELRNGTELSFGLNELGTLKRIASGSNLEEGDGAVLEGIWSRLVNLGSSRARRLSGSLKLGNYSDAFEKLGNAQKGKLIIGLVRLFNAAANVVDMTSVKGKRYVGTILVSHDKLLSDPKISYFIIDQSVTGMFERRTRVGL